MKRRAGHVALVGRPNVGKSTLLNQLLGQKLVITSHKPQTTRHSIMGISTSDVGQIVFVDTPGIHQRGAKAMNRYLNRAASSTLLNVDLIVFVVDVNHWSDEDNMVLKQVQQSKLPVIVAVNKIDQISQREFLLPKLAEIAEKTQVENIVPVSAKKGDNCDGLEKQIFKMLPVGENIFPEDQITDRPERFFAAELIREQITRRYHKEIPYAVSIQIEEFEVQPNIYHIGALIWVERENQKGILVGKGGQALKETATEARKEMEDFFQQKVYLRLWVKVKDSWSSDMNSLNQLGYTD